MAADGGVAPCRVCGAWWQYLVSEQERGRFGRWRRVRWWHVFAIHEVEKEIARRALYAARMQEQDRTEETP
ncbi:hypothetical protein [Agrococcus sp. GCM10030265]|uniref:hypothetical protein n=1 Tax=Agrococcus sp. GCM10030265 TaxID=3273378 RepID=UPI00366CF78D